MSKNCKFKSKNHEIIGRFLNPEKAKTDKHFWPREMTLSGKVIKKYPFEFLQQLKEPFVTKMTSLAWFLTEEGETYLTHQFFNFKKENINLSFVPEQIELFENKIGEDVILVKKPRTLKEFIAYGKN